MIGFEINSGYTEMLLVLI